MNTLYLDLFSGISGDMFLGALLDLGVEPRALETELAKLGLEGYHLHVSRQARGGLAGTKFDVHLETEAPHHHHEPDQGSAAGPQHPSEAPPGTDHPHPHPGHEPHHSARPHDHPHGRNFADIRHLIHHSALSEWVKQKSLAVFQRVADAEGRVHGQPPDAVHFHEVGALDSIIDLVGACVALEALGRPQVLASAVVEGTGTLQCAHGLLPLPAPATLEILRARGVTVTQCEEPHELITPTGAALLAEFAESFAPLRDLAVTRVGYGLGSRQNRTRPNVLRALWGETAAASPHDWETDRIWVLETNLDDINPELLGALVEKTLAAGALDVFHTPIQMKKNRPAVLLAILCAEADADRFTELLLRETTAFGVRRSAAERRKLRREMRTVPTPFGDIEVKLGWLDGHVIQAAPEFESCRRCAAQAGVPLKQVYEAAQALKPRTPAPATAGSTPGDALG